MTKKTVVALCMPVADRIDPNCFQSYRFLDRSGVDAWHHFSITGFPVDIARNEITRQVLANPDITHLLWIDDDMVYPPGALQRMLAHDLPFVGGLCFDRRHPYKPVLARYFHPSWGYDPNALGWLFDYPPDEVIEVDATGGAFLLVKREVYEAISAKHGEGDPAWAHWWTPLPWHGASEDLSFCRRAQEAGYTLRVDTGLKIGHVGEVIVDEAFAKRNRAFEYGKWHPPLEALAMAAATRAPDPTTEAIIHETGAPIASIVITTHDDRAEYLLAAVRSALAQTVPVEVIVVDDGSVVPASEIMAAAQDPAFRHQHLRIIRQENRGVSGALNTGIAAMGTEWFCWLPADDSHEPDKVERQLSALLAANRKAGYTGYHMKLDNGNRIAHVQTPIFRSKEEQDFVLSRGCAINGTTVMIHKSILDAVGLFDPRLRYAQDWDMWCRVGRLTQWFGMPDKLATRREFGNLTERLKQSKNPRKVEEDEIVMRRYEVTP